MDLPELARRAELPLLARVHDPLRPRHGKECSAFDTSGKSNLRELSTVLHSTVMCRRLKKDVAADLPPKQRRVVELSSGTRLRAALAEESRTLAELAGLGASPRVAFEEIARVRAETAVAKTGAVCAHLDTLLSGGADKLVVFAHHIAVLDAITERFGPRSVRVDGSVTAKARYQAVERFQNDPDISLFVGQIDAAGTGLTLTASAHVVFAELPWTPAQLVQAEDRCHRIGQHRPMLSEILVAAGSYDVRMADIIADKAETVHAAVDNPDPNSFTTTSPGRASDEAAEIRSPNRRRIRPSRPERTANCEKTPTSCSQPVTGRYSTTLSAASPRRTATGPCTSTESASPGTPADPATASLT